MLEPNALAICITLVTYSDHIDYALSIEDLVDDPPISPTRMRQRFSAPSSFVTPSRRGLWLSASIFLRMRRATGGSRASSSFRAERANVMEYSGTRLSFNPFFKSLLYRCQSLSRLFASFVGKIRVVEVFPERAVALQINEHRFLASSAVDEESNPRDVHGFLRFR
jgi:hypothetical protein